MNLAPNYDTTITPTYFTERGFQLTDLFRYLTPTTDGRALISILPNDLAFPIFKQKQNQIYQSSPNSIKQAQLLRLLNDGNTRYSLSWQNNTRYNEYWSANLDYNYVSDDYYLEDFKGINGYTQNQLLQLGEVNFNSEHWNFTGRLQNYQTLHPIDVDSNFQNQYSKLPQLILGSDYPDQLGGLDFFVAGEATHFDIRNAPGDTTKFPMGNRVHVQPGLALPFNRPYLFMNARAQVALTQYELGDVNNFTSRHQDRAVPIIDIATKLFFDKEMNFFNHPYQQTLEPANLLCIYPLSLAKRAYRFLTLPSTRQVMINFSPTIVLVESTVLVMRIKLASVLSPV